MEKIVGASTLKKVAGCIIDDIDKKLDGKSFKYLTQEEYINLSDEEKENENIVYQITDGMASYEDLTDKPDLSIYITKEEMQQELDVVKQSVSNGKQLLADALTDMGIPTSANESFKEIANKILLLDKKR